MVGAYLFQHQIDLLDLFHARRAGRIDHGCSSKSAWMVSSERGAEGCHQLVRQFANEQAYGVGNNDLLPRRRDKYGAEVVSRVANNWSAA